MDLSNFVKSYNIKNKTNYTEKEFFEEFKVKQNLSLVVISEMIGSNPKYISDRLKELGFVLKQNGGCKKNLKKIDRIIELSKSGVNASQISEVTGVNKCSVLKILRESGVDNRKLYLGKTLKARFYKFSREELENLDIDQLCKKLNTDNKSYLYLLLRQRNIEYKSRRLDKIKLSKNLW